MAARLPSPAHAQSWERHTSSLVSQCSEPYSRAMNRASFYSPQAGKRIDAPLRTSARFAIGDIVRHRMFDFRGVVFDIDPVFANSEEWYESIPAEVRPSREQPFYHLLAENGDSSYVAYVSQQNLLSDGDAGPVDHPSLDELFEEFDEGRYRLRRSLTH
jgi:heat shock protein HspQ